MKPNRLFLAATAALALCGTAQAADLYPIYGGMGSAPELTPVEVGNGWYLRADVSYDLESDFDGSMNGVSPTLGTAALDSARFEDGFSGGLGIGYRLNDFLRTDVTARYGKSDVGFGATIGPEFDPRFSNCAGYSCSAIDAGEATTWDLMANAYVDLGTFAGLTPYVGAGAGAVRVEYEGAGFNCSPFAPSSLCTSPVATGADDWRFAYALSAGVGFNVSRNLTLDLGYRYLNVEGGNAYEVTANTPAGFPRSYAIEDDGFDRHTIQAAIRYSLW